MKKNKMMRIASVLLIAVLMTTCAISGTFAKYVTEADGSDNARVAKFGVVVSIEDDMEMFSNSYDVDTSLDVAEAKAVYHATAQLVAPGTKGFTSFTVTGTPEVATRITVDTEDSQTIQLAAGSYTLGAGEYANDETTVTIDAVYEPIKFYFGTDAITANTTYTLTLDELLDELGELAIDNAPGTELDETYYIGWSWAFEDNSNANANFLDTYLAQEDTAQEIILNLAIRVEQVD